MNLLYVKSIVAMVSTCSAVMVGLLSHADSVASWGTLAVVGVLAPTILMHRWHEPLPSMSENIRQGLR